MDLLPYDDIEQLIKHRDGWCVSLFLPTERAGADVRGNDTRFKNLLRDAEEQLEANGVRPADARAFLAEARLLEENDTFWQEQSGGLAVFIARDLMQTYRLPLRFESSVIVSDRFHVKPLLPWVMNDGRFYLLALSQNQVRLLEGGRDGLDEVALETVPESMAEALRYDDPEQQLQQHASGPLSAGEGTAGRTGRGAAMFHGHGVGDETDVKENLLRYFQQIEAELTDFLHEQQAPLILAGVEYLHAIYRQANGHEYLLEEGIKGNPDEMSAKELHRRAWPIVEAHFQLKVQEAINRFADLSNSTRVSSALEEIVPAAAYGRVDTLFVPVESFRWGHFDAETGEVELHEERQPGDQDLLDLAAVEALNNGGTVLALSADQIPGNGPVAAVFRYADGAGAETR